MNNIKIESLGPIRNANINLGDLTLLVGPQASGKSILLQFIKLLADKGHIRRTIEQYGFIWEQKVYSIIDIILGEGMSGIITPETKIFLDDQYYPIEHLIKEPHTDKESLFYIPNQRVICLQNGWPRFFTDYEHSVPYVLRYFSETLRQYLERNTDQKNNIIFPQKERKATTLQSACKDRIFHDATITIDHTVKKRFKLNVENSSIPYMAWSSGQKEFLPLLLSFYLLSSSMDSFPKEDIKYIIIEEPEMGLHPLSIESVILQLIDLLTQGYRVIVSTHSPILLEFTWVFRYLKEANANGKALTELFGFTESESNSLKDILRSKSINTYFFDNKSNQVIIRDISTLDCTNHDKSANWGGLSSFISKASDMISRFASTE